MSWGEIKSAVNSTVGAALKPLDQIILEQSGENYYNTAKLIAQTSAVPDTVWIVPRLNSTPTSESDIPPNKGEITEVIFSPETKIIANTFQGFTLLTDVYAPFVEEIQINAFANDRNLKSIVLGRPLKQYSRNAFVYCTKLTEIHYMGSVAEWNNISKSTANPAGLPNPTVYCIDGQAEF